ncbi:MAG: conserved phage C-terminal domain-containing protein [Gammaproteobacteria bacterium]|nr:conserved phage C-terminal domain-containing protein [Gammaproteobacteria bacterium]
MRIYGSIQISFWENSDIQLLSDQSKLLAIYLLTGPHSNMLGCFRLPDGYITEDLNWEIKNAKNSFNKLSEIDFLTRDYDSSWVAIHHFLKWNPIQNPRQGIGIQKLFDIVPTKSIVFKPLINGLLTHGKYLEKGFLDRLYTLQKTIVTLSEECIADKEQNQDQEQDNKKIFMSGKPDVVTFHNNLSTTNQSLKSQALEVLEFLNEKTGRAYRPVEENIKLIIARIKSGATVLNCRQVIAKKTREWHGDLKMSEYLRPATLFNAIKFEQYMGELVVPKDEEESYELD